MLEAVAIRVVDPRRAARVEHADQRRADLAERHLAGRRHVDDRQRQAAGKRVQHVLGRIRRLVVPEQHGRLAGIEHERDLARGVLLPGAPEALDGRAAVRPVDPAVRGAELEACERGVGLHGVQRAVHLGGVDAVADRSGGCRHGATSPVPGCLSVNGGQTAAARER